MSSEDCLHIRLSDYLQRRREPSAEEEPPPPDAELPGEAAEDMAERG